MLMLFLALLAGGSQAVRIDAARIDDADVSGEVYGANRSAKGGGDVELLQWGKPCKPKDKKKKCAEHLECRSGGAPARNTCLHKNYLGQYLDPCLENKECMSERCNKEEANPASKTGGSKGGVEAWKQAGACDADGGLFSVPCRPSGARTCATGLSCHKTLEICTMPYAPDNAVCVDSADCKSGSCVEWSGEREVLGDGERGYCKGEPAAAIADPMEDCVEENKKRRRKELLVKLAQTGLMLLTTGIVVPWSGVSGMLSVRWTANEDSCRTIAESHAEDTGIEDDEEAIEEEKNKCLALSWGAFLGQLGFKQVVGKLVWFIACAIQAYYETLFTPGAVLAAFLNPIHGYIYGMVQDAISCGRKQVQVVHQELAGAVEALDERLTVWKGLTASLESQSHEVTDLLGQLTTLKSMNKEHLENMIAFMSRSPNLATAEQIKEDKDDMARLDAKMRQGVQLMTETIDDISQSMIHASEMISLLNDGRVKLMSAFKSAGDADGKFAQALQDQIDEEVMTKDYMNQNVMVGSIMSVITNLVKQL